MANQKIELGPSGRRLARNVASRRRELGRDLASVSEHLGALGRPIGVSALSKVEQGVRRVDADDLTALSIALRTTPGWLLLHPAQADQSVQLTEKTWFLGDVAWMWIVGERPLDDSDLILDALEQEEEAMPSDRRPIPKISMHPRTDWASENFQFRGRNRPTEPNPLPGTLKSEVRDSPAIADLEKAYKAAVSSGIPLPILDTLFEEIRRENKPPTDWRAWLDSAKGMPDGND